MTRWFCREDGSVSVYFMVVLVPIFLFHAVLIDFVRIKAAERETEHAVKAGARSVMSRFDARLQQYGIYGRETDEAEMTKMLAEVVEENLTVSSNSGFKYLDTRISPDSSQIKSVYTLANQTVLKGEILEEMKFRAPMEYSLEAIQKFKKSGQTDQLNTASRFSQNAEEIEKRIRKLNSALDEAWDTSQTLIHHTEDVFERNKKLLHDINEWAEKVGLHTLEEVKSSISVINDDINRISNQISALNQSIRNTETSLSGLAGSVKENAERVKSIQESIRSTESAISSLNNSMNELSQKKLNLEQLLKDIIAYLALIQSSKLEIAAMNERLESDYQSLTIKIGEAVQANRDLMTEKKKLTDTAGAEFTSDKVFGNIPVYDDEFFANYKTMSGKIPAAMNALKMKWLDTYKFSGDNFSQLVEANDRMSQLAAAFKSEQGRKEEERSARLSSILGKKGENKLSTQKALNELKNAMDGCGSVGDEGPYSGYYDSLIGKGKSQGQGLYQKYLNYQSASVSLQDDAPYRPLDSDATIKQAMDLPVKLSSIMEGMRDEFYIDEFALTKFSYRTLSAITTELSIPEQHPLGNQEAEFLLYGFNSCAANYAAAYGEMYVLFLAIRTAEALASPKTEWLNIGSPLLVLAAAAAQGAAEALSDMKRLIKGEEVALSEKFGRLTVNYKDLLRIFFLLHSHNERMLSRMQALLELNTGRDLTKQTSYIQASSAASVNLWFTPKFLKILHAEGITGCRMAGGRCEIRKTAVVSY